ncbi:MAG: hypothetical protein GY715_06155 [Planctomycetes bacterium]|nr:hypothetical protein [Planctomycetota bacterium]
MTRAVAARIEQRAASNPEVVLPPTLVFKSTVDATVTTDAVIDNLLGHLQPHRHELVLFDINRRAASYRLLIDDPAPMTNRVLKATDLPFSVTLVTNGSAQTARVENRHIEPYALDPGRSRNWNWRGRPA